MDSENKFSVVNIEKIEIPNSIDGAIDNVLNKPSRTVGEILNDCLFMVFGKISLNANKKRIAYSVELENFKNALENKVNNIPSNKRVEPDIHSVCAALDNLKFCLQKEELQKLFLNLISSSVNIEKCNMVHPSYGEIIKQMESCDALLFKELFENEENPVIIIGIYEDNGGYRLVSTNIVEAGFTYVNNVGKSLDNLARLKLLEVRYDLFYNDKQKYENLKNRPEIRNYISSLSERYPGKRIFIKEGVINFTEFGCDFYHVCCN